MKINKNIKKRLIEKIAKEIKEELKEDILNEILKQLNEEKQDNEIKYKVEDIIFATRNIAEDTLKKMHEILDKYGIVRVTDLYDLADITRDYDYKDNLYGWTNLNDAIILESHSGYFIKMPKPIKI